MHENRRGHLPSVKKSKFEWEKFDALPPALKELCWNGILPAHCSNPENSLKNIKYVKAKKEEREAHATLLMYGPDHPQAGLPAGGVMPLSRGACHPAKRHNGETEMKTYAFDFAKQSIKAYLTRQEARNAGNGAHLASTPEEFLEFRTTTSEIVALYNKLVPDAPVSKFSDKATAAKRMIALAEAKAQLVPSTIPVENNSLKENDEMAKSAAKAQKSAVKVSRPKKESSTTRGRTSEFAGKSLTATMDENPRREGTWGHQSYAIILKKPGISYEAYIQAGGRRQDLAWDLLRKWVKLS